MTGLASQDPRHALSPLRLEKRSSAGTRLMLLTPGSSLRRPSVPSTSKRRSSSLLTNPAMLPSLFLLASYPTSGNGFVRSVFTQATGLGTASLYREQENPSPLYHSEDGWTLFVDPKRKPKPHSTTLVKTHSLPSKFGDFSAVRGVVLLVRNPGDNRIHNKLRWSRCKRARHSRSKDLSHCYQREGSTVCSQLTVDFPNRQWTIFHRRWLEFARSHPELPVLLLHYEDLVVRPSETMQQLLDFMDVPFRFPLQADKHLHRESQPVVGQELSKYCSEEVVQDFVATFAPLAKELGYVWDEELRAYTWSPSSTLTAAAPR